MQTKEAWLGKAPDMRCRAHGAWGHLGCLYCPLSEGRGKVGTLGGVRLAAGFHTDS